MPSERIIELRRHLREKFPAAHRFDPSSSHSSAPPRAPCPGPCPLPPSAPPLPPPPGTLAEFAGSGPGSGLSLVVAALLANPDAASPARPLALVDARDSFDPASFPPGECACLLWVRCRETDAALRAADLLLRDGNLPLVVLDLGTLPARELRRIPLAVWHRLRQLAATTRTTLLTLTPIPSIPVAQTRQILPATLRLSHLDHPRPAPSPKTWKNEQASRNLA